MSPTFLCGESCGTVCAVAVAEWLQQRHGMTLNGLVLISSVIDFGTQNLIGNLMDLRDAEACLNFLPSHSP